MIHRAAPGTRAVRPPGPRRVRRLTVATFATLLAAGAAGCSGSSGPTPTTTAVDTVAIAVAECTALQDAVAAINETYPNGVGLVVGKAPSGGQVKALQALLDAVRVIEPATPDLLSIQNAIVVASQTLINRGDAGEPVTQEDQDAFAGAFLAASTYCAPAATGGTPGTAPTAPATPTGIPTPPITTTTPATPATTVPAAPATTPAG